MATKINPYKILGVSPSCSDKEVKDAYKAAVKKFHPDITNDPETSKKLLVIRKAYEYIVKKRKSSVKSGDFSSVETSINVFTRSVEQSVKDEVRLKFQYKVVEVDLVTARNGGTLTDWIYVNNFCFHCSGTGIEERAGSDNMCYDCIGTGTVKSSYGVMRIQKKCDTCDGTGLSKERSCKHCSGMGEVREKKDFKFVLPSGVSSGFQMEIDPVVGDCDENKFRSMILSVQTTGFGNFDTDEHGNLTLHKEIDYIKYLIGGDFYIPEIDTTVNLPLGDNNESHHELTISAERNKYNLPIRIFLDVGKLDELKPESIADLSSWYHKYYG